MTVAVQPKCHDIVVVNF